MSRSARKCSFYDFGSFRIDAANRLLLQGGEVVSLQPKTFDILLLLVENRGRVLDKEELLSRAWPDTVVEESNLTQNIYVLRRIFSADADGQKYIETLPRRGYRFIAPVREGAEPLTDAEAPAVQAAARDQSNLPSTPQADRTEAELHVAPASTATVSPQPGDNPPRAYDPAITQLPVVRGRGRAARWKWVLTGLLVLLALGLAAYFLTRRPSSPKLIQSIAVLPLAPLNADADQESLGLGIADDLITRLSSTRQIVVRPMSLVIRQGGGVQDPIAIGQALAVDAVLTGTVRKANDRIRVNAQLIRVSDGAPLWAQTFDVKLADILAMQDQVSEQLAQALTLQLNGEAMRLLTRHYTENAEAYQLYLKGDYYLKKRTREGFNTSIEYLEQALKKDPQYGLAYRGLAAAYSLQSLFGFAPPKQAMPQAEAMARRALELDAGLAGAHVALGGVRMHYDWDLTTAAREFQRAIELDPALPEAHQLYALCLAAMGRFDEARKQLQTARQLDPGSLVIESSVVWVAYLSGQYDDAIALGRQALELDSRFYLFHQHLGFAYLAKNMAEPAIAALQRARILSANAPASLARLGYAQAVAGKQQEARQALDELQKGAAPAHVIAWVYIGLNEHERALMWLEKAYEERASDLVYLATDPIYDRLRATPRFKALLQRTGLASSPSA